jgi:hypothetical protein
LAVLIVGTICGVVADVARETRWAEVDLASELPEDLLEPRGKTRWDLTGLSLGASTVRTVERIADDAGALAERRSAPAGLRGREVRYADSVEGEAVARWLLPDSDPHLLDVRDLQPIRLERHGAQGIDDLWIRTQRVGVGWLFLPSGPREVVLQEVLVMRRAAGTSRFEPESLIHRWIDKNVGTVAEVEGPTHDGNERTSIRAAYVLEELLRGGEQPRVYIEQHDTEVETVVRYGWNRGVVSGSDVFVPIDELTPEAYATLGELTAAPSWDFSGNNPTNYPGIQEVASTKTIPASNRTENWGECALMDSDPPGRKMSREDGDFLDPANATITLSIVEREGGVDSPGTLWLRGAINNEGVGGLDLNSEARVCHDGGGRTPIPLWHFGNEDANGDWYATVGDTWESAVLGCEQTIKISFLNLHTGPCTGTGIGDLSGQQASTVIGAGPVTLPSGHTFNSLLVRNVVEYCVFLGDTCNNSFGNVRTGLHLWEVPWIGTVARLSTVNDAPEDYLTRSDALSDLASADIKFGLFPPRSITVTNTGPTSVELSWDPGLPIATAHIDGYKVYWDMVSGADTAGAYAQNSDTHAGQVTINGTTATVTGLTGGTQYFFTVTSLSDHCDVGLCRYDAGTTCTPGNDPICTSPTHYESLIFPTTLSGGPAPVPAEVSAIPGSGCVPTSEVTGVTVNKAGSDIEICWDLTADTCASGYQVLGADTPESDANYSVLVADTGLTSCATIDPSESFFQVLVKGDGGTGPWGHYGR